RSARLPSDGSRADRAGRAAGRGAGARGRRAARYLPVRRAAAGGRRARQAADAARDRHRHARRRARHRRRRPRRQRVRLGRAAEWHGARRLGARQRVERRRADSHKTEETLMASPKVGEMRLHDYILPPLSAGRYRLQVETEVKVDGAAQPLDDQQAYFDIDGPRFALAPTEVAGLFPPRNGHGPFDEAIPHLALGRRTLPWERPFAAARITVDNTPLNMNGTPIPWMALLVFEDSECVVEVKQKIGVKLPAAVVTRLGVPTDLLVDTVTAERGLVRDLMPAYEELALLAHVREVNVDDRELAAGDSDGYFAVIMGNRIPQRGKKYRCCLVSIEERTDIVPAWATSLPDPPAVGGLFFENADELFNTAGTRKETQYVDKQAKLGGKFGT